jgi:hypothetical protein
MYDRARWTGKAAEANIFRAWLVENLREVVEMTDDETSVEGEARSRSTHG